MSRQLPVLTRKIDINNENVKEIYNTENIGELRSFYKDVIKSYTGADCWGL